ncbi:MAG TPA: AsmA family protein [Candidatus Binatia bacterium]|nr:AsmA family protein [Candidatus Binatia bacterium]
MKPWMKIAAIVLGVLIVIVIAVPLFVDANTFRPTLESDLTGALGRQVKVGNLSLSLFSGSVKADNISIADDPAFSSSPFVQAKSLKVGVEIFPLIFSKALNVTELTLNQPEISLVRSPDGAKWNFSSLGGKNSPAPSPSAQPAPASPAGGNPNLSVAKLNVTDGRLTVSKAGSSAPPRVYDKVAIEVKNFSFTNSFPFKMAADLPAGGTLKLDGTAGPIDPNNAAQTPLQAKVSINHMNLAASGFIDPASGVAGLADFDGTVASDGKEAKTSGTLKADKLQVVQKGSPAGRTVQVNYTVTHHLATQQGTLTQCEVSLGKAVSNVSGTYDAHGAVTSINMKMTGQGMPVDDLEAMLPAVGVILPSGSQLKGGTLALNFTIVGPVDKLVTTGTLKMENAALQGFSLGSKLSAIPAIGGKGSGEKDTTIKNFSADVRVAPEGTKADNIDLSVPPFGSVTGAGTVSPSNALDFKMKADMIPFTIQGTTSDPKFAPDMKGMATGLLKGVTGNKNPASSLGGLFKKKTN